MRHPHLLVLAMSMCGVAAAQPAPAGRKITIAIYAPNAPFASSAERFSYITRLAQQIGSVTGLVTEGKAFARASDLETAIKAKSIDFAILDGVYLAERGVPFTVMATATTGGETAPRWALYTAGGGDVRALQGKRIAVARAGARDDDFLGNALLDGEIQIKKFFTGGRTEAPDLAGALAALNLKKAEAVFLPEAFGKGLKSVFDAGRVPNAAFCDLATGVGGEVVSKVRTALLGYSAGAALEGWKSSDAGPYRALASRLTTRAKRPVFAEPTTVKLEDLDVLVAPQLEPQQPDLRAQFWVPTP